MSELTGVYYVALLVDRRVVNAKVAIVDGDRTKVEIGGMTLCLDFISEGQVGVIREPYDISDYFGTVVANQEPTRFSRGVVIGFYPGESGQVLAQWWSESIESMNMILDAVGI